MTFVEEMKEMMWNSDQSINSHTLSAPLPSEAFYSLHFSFHLWSHPCKASLWGAENWFFTQQSLSLHIRVPSSCLLLPGSRTLSLFTGMAPDLVTPHFLQDHVLRTFRILFPQVPGSPYHWYKTCLLVDPPGSLSYAQSVLANSMFFIDLLDRMT